MRVAGLIIEMPGDGKQRVELQRKLDEQKTIYKEYSRLKAKDGEYCVKARGNQTGNIKSK